MRTRLLLTLLAAFACSALAESKTPGADFDWSKPPAPFSEPRFRVPRPHRFKLKNGLTVLVIENHKLPLISMGLVVPGAGAASDPIGQAGLASFTADLLDEGAGNLNAVQISDLRESLGAQIEGFAATETAYVDVTSLTRTFDATLDLFTTIVTQPSFDPHETGRVHNDRLTSLKLRRDRPREVAGMLFNGTLYGPQSGYGHPALGYVDEFAKLDAQAARRFYAQAWDPAKMTLVVAGDVKRAALRMKLEAKLGGWKLVGTESITTPLSPPAPLDARLVLVDRPGAEQTDTIIGLAGINRNDPRRASFEVATEVLGGGFTGRLMQRLREQLGYVYGVHAAMEYRHDLGAYVISGAFFGPKTVDGLKETLLMLHDLAEKEVPEEELQKAKQNMIRSLPQSFESNAGLVNAYKVVAREGLPLNWYDKWLGEIGKVTAAQARAAAKAILVENKLVVVAVGDLSVLRPGMEKLSFGPAKLYDLDGKPVK